MAEWPARGQQAPDFWDTVLKEYIDEGDATNAPLASPTFTGDPKAPTPALTDNDTSIATTAFVKAAVAALVDSSPATLDTLNELAAALGDDPNFATTMTNALAAKAPSASPVFTGNPTGPTPATSDDDTSLATTAFVKAAIAAAGTWQSYTPTINTGWAVGTGGSLTGRYAVIGKTVHFRIAMVLGTGFSAPSAGIGLRLPPLNVANVGASHKISTVTAWFTDAGSNNYMAFPLLTSDHVVVYVMGTNGAAGNPSASNPFTWAAGDIIEVAGTYETV